MFSTKLVFAGYEKATILSPEVRMRLFKGLTISKGLSCLLLFLFYSILFYSVFISGVISFFFIFFY